MGIKELIHREVRFQAKKVVSEAEERASLILQKAEEERRKIVNEYRPVAEDTYRQTYISIISKAKKEASKKVLTAQKEILDEARRVALENIKSRIRSKASYTEILKNLVEEAIPYMKSDVEIHVNPGDVDVVKEIISELPEEWVINPPKDITVWDVNINTWEVVPDENVWAGLVFVDKRRKFVLNNDLKVRLETAYRMMLEKFKGEVEIEG